MPVFLAFAAFALFLDQLSKYLVRVNIPNGGRRELVSGWIHLQHVHNHGAAWGVLAGQKFLLIAFTAVVVAVMSFTAREVVSRGILASTGYGLILGGAIGNLVDRVFQGYVTDFLDLDTPIRYLQTFPVFNGADSALTVGVILMMVSLIFAREPIESEISESSQP